MKLSDQKNNNERPSNTLASVLLSTFLTAGPLVVLSVGLLAPSAKAHEKEILDLISVTGVCNREISPDRVKVAFEVNILANDRQNSSNEANEIYEKLHTKIKSLSLKDLELSTSNYSVRPEYEWQKSTRRFKGYRTNITLNVKTSSQEKTGLLIETGNKVGVHQINGPSPFVSTSLFEKAYIDCLKTASKDAVTKADILAEGLGVKRGLLRTAREERVPSNISAPRHYMAKTTSMEMADGHSAPPAIEISKQKIQIRLHAQFGIQ